MRMGGRPNLSGNGKLVDGATWHLHLDVFVWASRSWTEHNCLLRIKPCKTAFKQCGVCHRTAIVSVRMCASRKVMSRGEIVH